MSNIIDPRAKQIITNTNGDIIQNTLSDFGENLPTNLPTSTPSTPAQNLAQDSTHPLTPSAAGGGINPAQDFSLDSTPNPSQLAQSTPAQLAQNPLQAQNQRGQTRYARDIDSTQNQSQDSTPKSSDYKPPTTQTKTYSLNKYILNDIDADDPAQALDLLRNTPTNISWEGVDNALNNGISPSAILERFADIAEQNPRALWISLERPLSKAEQARARFDYERGQISQDELDNLKSQTTLKSLTKSLFGLDSSQKQKANLTLAKFAERGESYENLPKEAQSVLNIQGKDSYALNIKSIFTGKSEGELLYEQKQEEAKIYQKIKNKESLSQDELDAIDAYGAGAGFGSDKEKQEQWLLKYEANNIIPSYTQSMVYALENKADYKALFFGSGKGKQKDKERFLHGLDGIAKLSGFDSASVDEKSGDIFFTKDDFSYQVNTRFLDNIENTLKANAFSIGGSIAGSIAGAKALGKNPAGLITGIVGGGALGAFAGGTLDGVIADLYTNNKINFAENLRHGLHEGIFNIAGDAIVAGAIKGGKYIIKAGKNFTPQGIKEGISNAAQGIKNLTNNILEYSIVGQAAKNVFDGNASAVRSFLKDIPQEQRESIRQGIKDFGLELELNPKSNQALSNFTAKYGEAHPNLANTAQKVYDIFTLPAGKELQQELISAIRADNTGGLVGFLSEAANSSPALQQSLHNILNQTHARAINHLKSFGLKQNDIAQIFEAYQKGTKEAYAKALDMIQEVFKDDKAKISRKNYDLLTTELKQSALDEKDLNYLKTLEAKIYGLSENGSPRSFENLKDALALLNERWNKHAKNMNFTGEKLRRVEKQMREDIKQGINEIFASSSQGGKFRELFESALADYGNMKGILKAVDKLKLRDTDIAYQKTLNKMLDFLIAGEKGDLSNLAKLTAHLPKEQKIKFELATLNALLEKSIFSAKNGDSVVLEVLNSGQFLSRLESIAGEFSTPQAKEYIDFVKEFHSLFKNDYAIGQATLEPALTQKMGGGIATTPMGRFEYQRAKLIYDSIVRLMPRIPFLSSFNEKVSAAAVRFHLKSALRKSHSIGELKRTLDFKAQEGKFDSPTNRVISQIMGEVESSYDGIIKELNTNNEIGISGGSDISVNTGGKVDSVETLANNRQQPAQTLDNEIIAQNATAQQALESLSQTQATQMPNKISINDFMQSLDEVGNKANFIEHLLSKGDAEQRIAMLNLVEPTLKSPDIVAQVAENGIKKEKHIKKFSDGKEFFYLLASKENGSVLLTGFKTSRLNTIEKELENADIIQTFIRQGSKQETSSRLGLPSDEIVSQQAQNNPNLAQNLTEIQKKDKIKQDIFSLAKEQKEAQKQAQLEKAQADSDFIAKREAQKQARIDKILAEQKASQGITTLEARAKIKAEQMGEDIPYTRLSDTHIILDDITYPAEFVIIDKADLKPSFEAGGFQTREVKQDNKIAQIRDNFDPLKIFGKVGEYDGLPLIARNGEIIAGNHRGQAIKELSGENLARYNEYAKKVFGVDLGEGKIIVRKILDDTEHINGANLLEQIALAARSNKGAETTLGEQATSALGTYKDKIQTELLENKARRYIESDSVDNQMQAVANILKAPLKTEEANLALLASLSKASHNLDIAKALDMIEGDDLLKAKIKKMLIANAGGFYNISRSIATPKLNEITHYLVDAIAYLGKASKQSGSENINRSEAYRELATKINDRVSGKVQAFKGMETPLSEFIAQTKADVLGATLSKFANQDHASQRLYEVLRDMPEVLEKKFAEPSFDFFGDAEVKALKDVDMYDFLDYMIGRGQQNQATSELKDALIGLKKLESSQPNNTPPSTKPTPPSTKPTPPSTPNANNPNNTNNTPPTRASAQNLSSTDSAKNPPPATEGDTGGGLFDLSSQAQNQTPNKTTLQKDLSTQEIKEAVQKWDLDNPNPNDKLLVSLVQGDELEKLSKEFDFKGNYAIAREIDSKGIKHALMQHGDKAKESARGQIAITKDDIAQYQQYTQNPDLRILQENNRIVYAKQVNGHYVVIEEILTGQNKLQFFDMWKGKGKINEEVLLSHSQRPKHDFEPNSNRRMPSNTDGIIPQPAKNTIDNPPKNLADLQDPRYERYKELESSLDYRFENKFKKQAERELGKSLDIEKLDKDLLARNITYTDHARITKEINNDYTKWLDTQKQAENKEILDYFSDLAEYRELHNDLYKKFIDIKSKAENKQAHLEWLENYKHRMINKTDEEIIATEIKKPKNPNAKDKKEYFTYDEAKHLLANTRKRLEKAFNIEPIKEFGTNYAEFYQDGKGAIAKLIAEANAAKEVGQDFSGQVAGAFSKEIDGAPARIDLVWGNEKMGLEKIVQKHLDDFSDFSGGNPHEKLANGLSEIITRGEVVEKDGVKTIWLKENDKNFVAGLSKGWKGNGENLWVITSYEKTKGQLPDLRGDSLNLSAYKAEFNPLLTSSDEPLNNEIIQKISQKFNKDEQYAKNLYEWHKDSHPLTKEADGTPKVFYHGNKNGNDISIFEDKYEVNGWGSWLTPNKDLAKTYGHIQEVMISGKNFLDLEKMQQQNNLIDIAKFFDLDEKIITEEMPNINNLFGWIKEAQEQAQREYLEILDFSKNGAYIKGFNGEILLLSKEKIRKQFRDELSIFNELLNEKSKIYKIFDRLYGNDKWFRKPIDLIINLSPYGYYGQKRAKDFLKSKGYDGVIIDKNQIVVFDSNQIKEVGNKGTFDATNPNIYHSSNTAGAAVLGGAIAGVEKDDEGNIVGFSPERFALGFAAGAGGAKALSGIFKHKQAQNYALKSIKNLQKEYQALQEHNLPLFAKIMSDISPQVFIKPSKEAKKLSNDIFNKELAQVIQNAINKDSIKELPQANFKNISEFRGNFDKVKNNIGYLDTPLGQIRVNTQYALHHFTNNTYYKDRTNIKGGFFETFRKPLFVIEDDTKGKGSIYFYKPFYDKDKNMLNLFGIGINQKGIINFKTYYLDEKKSRLKQLLKNEGVKIRYVAKE